MKRSLVLAAAASVVALWLGWDVLPKPHHDAFDALPDTLRVLGAAVFLFGVTGLGIVRMWLPESLRPREWLGVLPTGACALGIGFTFLGLLGPPFVASLVVRTAAGIVLSAVGVRRRGWPARGGADIAWPAWLGTLLVAVALFPLFGQHMAVPLGAG